MNKLVEIEGLNLRINDLELCNNLSFRVNEGERIGVTGPSGCGKSTLIKSIVKNKLPDASSFDKFDTNPSFAYSYMPQSSGLLPWFSLKKNIEIFSKSTNLTDKTITAFGLKDRLNVFPKQLSGGEYQRAILALAIINQPRVFVADEPLTELDFSNKWKLLVYWSNKIKELNSSLILVSHDLETLIYLCDKILILSDKPFNIKKEIIIENEHPREMDFLVSDDFVKAKSELLNMLDTQ